jgi:hypothetical protein
MHFSSEEVDVCLTAISTESSFKCAVVAAGLVDNVNATDTNVDPSAQSAATASQRLMVL